MLNCFQVNRNTQVTTLFTQVLAPIRRKSSYAAVEGTSKSTSKSISKGTKGNIKSTIKITTKGKIKSTSKRTSTFSASRASNRRLTFFYRGGSKEKLESHFRQLVIKRAMKKATQPVADIPAVYDLFAPFYLTATPFVGLKSRRKRRGKRVIHKLYPLDRIRSERKPFLALSSIVRTSGRSAKPFNSRLAHELDALYTASRSKGTVSTLREKRDLIHRTAYKARPYR